MIITKYNLRILRYIYRKKSVYYSKISKKFKDPRSFSTLYAPFSIPKR